MRVPEGARTPLLALCAAALMFIGVLALWQSLGQSTEMAGLRGGDGVVVEGVVVDAIQQPGSVRAPIGQPRGHRYCPEYRFETTTGEIDFLEVHSGCSTDKSAVEIGHRADIIYDPDDTGAAYLNDGSSQWVGLGLGSFAFLGGASIVAALVLGAVGRKRTRRTRSR